MKRRVREKKEKEGEEKERKEKEIRKEERVSVYRISQYCEEVPFRGIMDAHGSRARDNYHNKERI